MKGRVHYRQLYDDGQIVIGNAVSGGFYYGERSRAVTGRCSRVPFTVAMNRLLSICVTMGNTAPRSHTASVSGIASP